MNQEEFREIVKPYTMTDVARIDCLYDSLEYVRSNGFTGDFVECGVWKGGNILGIMKYLEYHQYFEPHVWAYDTFSGMTAPEDNDKDFLNNKASDILNDVLCYSPLDEVKATLSQSNYPRNKVTLVAGDVCQTLLNEEWLPKKIALLRLDTDWYASTKMELEVLWDRLEIGAPCIIDDYGHWLGCREAVDEFFFRLPCTHEAEVIDYTGIRVFRKC